MYIEQIYTGCLNEAAYFIESRGEAAIVDPIRDIDNYLDLAKAHKAVIKYIFITHFHREFITGHLELSKKTGASIVFGPTTQARFNFHLASDGEVFKIGDITIESVHTPGHTLESTSYLLKDEAGKPHCIFTGDTLLIGDIGRPDLSHANLSAQELAALVYHSVQNKFRPLPDDVIIYPAHIDDRGILESSDSEKQSTIGMEKKHNPAFKSQTMEEFILMLTKDMKEVPAYFALNAKNNKEGYSYMEDILEKGLISLTIDEFKEKIKQDYIILDTRNSMEFTQGFIPDSMSIGLEGKFEEWAGIILPFNKKVTLVTDPGKEKESITRLARVGFENVEGYLKGGFTEWKTAGSPLDLIIDIEADELAMDLPFDENLQVIDVRTQFEFAEGHVVHATNIPLRDLTDIAQIANLEEDQNIYIHSADGYESVIASALLKRQGYHNIRNILGGWKKIKEEENIPTEKSGEVLN